MAFQPFADGSKCSYTLRIQRRLISCHYVIHLLPSSHIQILSAWIVPRSLPLTAACHTHMHSHDQTWYVCNRRFCTTRSCSPCRLSWDSATYPLSAFKVLWSCQLQVPAARPTGSSQSSGHARFATSHQMRHGCVACFACWTGVQRRPNDGGVSIH